MLAPPAVGDVVDVGAGVGVGGSVDGFAIGVGSDKSIATAIAASAGDVDASGDGEGRKGDQLGQVVVEGHKGGCGGVVVGVPRVGVIVISHLQDRREGDGGCGGGVPGSDLVPTSLSCLLLASVLRSFVLLEVTAACKAGTTHTVTTNVRSFSCVHSDVTLQVATF